ncbi:MULTISPECIES: VOC family protein [unclassified Pseudovibrio]|uniref:VOC family protein n=1 Tax=unclassified Pseudovibrio TaxID=2627060 RepID=UPI0007AECC57|nr:MULTISPECIES: VOC family protein [unclassified Pseudovibrio]KZL14941.1 Glyoxalase/Bleomycin resistance protein/Dioxygenase superfamily protein [Pseudovibrio sp. Ad37]KZL23183.1 Glyoxalase/Bleomycin resistance protein/Dioxygenase superfamily protein [Pseudovibrio sp. WM33]
MEVHKGRLIDHVHLVVRDLQMSSKFYKTSLATLGRSLTHETDEFFIFDELFVTPATDGNVTRVHLAFMANSEDEVRAFYQAALDNGGHDNGAPGPRSYHPGYYAAFVLDPDGNNIEAVWHGPADRSCESVVFTPHDPPD